MNIILVRSLNWDLTFNINLKIMIKSTFKIFTLLIFADTSYIPYVGLE